MLDISRHFMINADTDAIAADGWMSAYIICRHLLLSRFRAALCRCRDTVRRDRGQLATPTHARSRRILPAGDAGTIFGYEWRAFMRLKRVR